MSIQILNGDKHQSIKQARLIGIYEGEKDNRECIENVSEGPISICAKLVLLLR